MAEEKILTKHPRGKSGKNISKPKYEAVKRAMLSVLRSRELTHAELTKALVAKLKGKFEGNISWYGETVRSSAARRARPLLRRNCPSASSLLDLGAREP